MQKIIIETIPHEEHRYTTVGDWYEKDGVLYIKVSNLSDWKREFMVALHELVEVALCRAEGVAEKSVDDFDKAFELAREEGNESEPGDDPKAPYRDQHCFATGIERMVCARFGISWKEYEDELCALPEIPDKS